MNYVQNRNRHCAKVEFGDEELTYAWQEPHESFGFKIKYYEIDLESFRWISKKNGFLYFLSICFGVLSLFPIFAGLFKPEESALIVGIGWLLASAIILIFYFRSKVSFNIYQTTKGNLYILKDKYEDAIIDELSKRNKESLKKLELLNQSESTLTH